ncbi:MAG: sigma-70 family RNA polymerase sigma factor [Thermoanaerobaculia bacterium]|nr:sigma-70 family RNA polymerase sigma factor [Thermoanaerobaculia bacterium]
MEPTLVDAVLDGDPDAFGLLIEKYEKPIFNVAYRITGSTDDAMDATQTAFTNAYENLEQFDPSHRFFSWIYRIAVNASLDMVKGRDEVEMSRPEPDPRRGPEERAEARETSARVQKALLELTEDHRTVIVLRHYLGLSYAEIGEVVSIPVKTVRSRLYEARQRLRSLLMDEHGKEH